MRAILIAFVGLLATTAAAEPPIMAIRQGPRTVDVGAWIVENVPPLQSPRGRWPLILWQTGPFTPQPRTVYEGLLARGVTQHVRLDKAHIPLALALQAAGSPVIVMEGQGGQWPATLAGDVSAWGRPRRATPPYGRGGGWSTGR